MEEVLMLTDYKGFFSYKYAAKPYQSGMDKRLLTEYFNKNGYVLHYAHYSEVEDLSLNLNGIPVLYSSSEDHGGHYKDYVEDVLWYLQERGARLIPDLKFFRAHHNKVFMELLRTQIKCKGMHSLQTRHFGTIEDLIRHLEVLLFPCVIKTAAGAGSRGVALVRSKDELIKVASRLSRTPFRKEEIIDRLRSVKYPGYVRESRHRGKFIVQTFIDGLSNDWKILIYGDKYYVLHRSVRPNDFRASGSGILKWDEELPDGLLEFTYQIFNEMKVPHVSLDVAYDGKNFHLIEFQAVRFGTFTLDNAPFYFLRKANGWEIIQSPSRLEEEYVSSVVQFLQHGI